MTEFLNFRPISRIWASKDNEKKDDKPLQDKSGKESSAGGGPNNNNNKDDDNDNDKLPSLLAKAFLWMLTAYMFIAIISLMFPGSSQPEVIQLQIFKIRYKKFILFLRLFVTFHGTNLFTTC